jgi:hypothetical protein
MALTKQGSPFVLSTTCERYFKRWKRPYISIPILGHFDLERKIILETDPFNLVITGVLSQYDDDNILHLVADFSRKHCSAAINYEIYNKELLAIMWAFTERHLLLNGSLHTIEVIVNHQNPTYFTTNRLLNYH